MDVSGENAPRREHCLTMLNIPQPLTTVKVAGGAETRKIALLRRILAFFGGR
jgi:hypothetical protein